jgi:hypothetical protein
MAPEIQEVVDLCKRGAEDWWAGRYAMVPACAWGALNQIVASASVAAEARGLLADAPEALGMFNAFTRQAATSTPDRGQMLAGYPVMMRGKLRVRPTLAAIPEDFLLEQARMLAPGGLAVLRFTPHLVDARALTGLALPELRTLADTLFNNPAKLPLPTPSCWSEWEEHMLLWLFVVDGTALLPAGAVVAANSVTGLIQQRTAGQPLLLATRPAQPAARLFMAYDMFRIQKVLTSLTGPWALTVRKHGQECGLDWPGGSAIIPIPEIPWPWLIQMLNVKMTTVGGTVHDATVEAGAA